MAMAATRAGHRRAGRTVGLGHRWKEFDVFMLITTVVLTGFGVVTVWSATGGGALTLGNDGVRQGLYGALGMALMIGIATVDYRFFASLAWPLYAFGVALLTLVLIPGIGADLGLGSRRWFLVPGIGTVQPSEFVKLTTAIALASFIASRGTAMTELGNFVVSLLIAGIPAALVFQQPDLGTSLIYGVIWASMMLVAHCRHRHVAVLLALAAAAPFVAWRFLLKDYQIDRWQVFMDPGSDPLGEGFNIMQAEISIGSGGLFGYGLQGGTQSQLGLLAVRESDFVFSHASGMFGFFGMLALLTSFVILLWRCLRVVDTAKDGFGQCFAMGVAGVLFVQSFVNIGMNLGLLPVTGITLPFVSAGLSSLWTFLLAEGILQSILMRHRKLAFQPT